MSAFENAYHFDILPELIDHPMYAAAKAAHETLSPAEQRIIQALSELPQEPIEFPEYRKQFVAIWCQDGEFPARMLLEMEPCGVRLSFHRNTAILLEKGLRQGTALRRYVDGKWVPVSWNEPMRVVKGEALGLRVRGVTQLSDWYNNMYAFE
ncbi:hypothetical protein MIND_01129400 [Mycena indigotica]|uniref:Uncharacterized protein n=1 Tax=Mycena indigotica TaxID=2126181 RepID=A0A8H6S701_9AGAR|nr:uncharacterized protein MIND_01122800 [Mycena indigotica]XP_037215675.1 uncharacterized protein MIND_01129400 [Mycena indigotica]KAF7293453.1 hypothetical protein MIND_01122800 [Mycena indigotica]KAF7293512.1 hypothetical protein MIND_01129400 [Mycena indigotica]